MIAALLARVALGASGAAAPEPAGTSSAVDALVFLLPAALALGGLFLWLFLRAVRGGQFDDLDDPPRRILEDD